MSNMDTAALHRKAAGLLKTWGSSSLPNGKTLSETMTIQGIPLWEVMCPELAVYILPKVFLPGKKSFSVFRRIRPYLGRAKQVALEYFALKRGTSGCSAWPQEPAILILGFNACITRDVLDPVIKRLSVPGSARSVILVDSWKGPAKSSSTDISGIQSIWQHWNRQAELHCRTMLGELKEAGAELKALRVLAHILKGDEQSLLTGMQAIFTWLLKQRLPQLVPHAVVARHILEHHKPALIISGDVADPRTRFYYLLGKQCGIPSLAIQYGLCTSNSVEYNFNLADQLVVFGEQSRRIMSANGVPPERIAVTGSPRHDKLVNGAITDVAGIRSQLGVPEGHAMVLFAATYYIPGYPDVKKLGLKMSKDLLEAVGKSSKVTLVVKPHPILNQAHEIKKIAGKRLNVVCADPRANIQNLIMACDAFVALGSTATLDALIANKLTITPVYPAWVGNDQFAESGATLVPRSAEELAQSLEIAVSPPLREKALADLEPARKRFLHDMVFKTDGQAVARILEIAREMSQARAENQAR